MIILSLFFVVHSQAQVTIFSENFGTPTGTTTFANYTIGTAPATFQNGSPITFTGTGEIRNTTVSAGYTGASAGGNVFLTNIVGRDLVIAGNNTSSFVSLSLSFGVFKSTIADNGSALIVEVSSDGTSYSALSFSALPTTAAGWYYRTATGTIPSTSNLRIRFRQNGASAQYRIDDVLLTGDYPGIVSAQSGNWSSTSTWVGGVVPNSATNAVISNGHTVVMDNISFATRDAGVRTTISSTGKLETGLVLNNNGIMTVNGSFQINQGGFGGGSGTWTYGSSSTLIYNHTTGNYGLVDNTHAYWPSASGPTNVTVLNALNTSGGITMGVARTVTGVFQTAAGVYLNAANLTLNGQAVINAGGFFQQSPIYGTSSLLKYNCNCTYGRGAEWLTGTGTIGITPGYPNDVQISNTSILNAPNTGAAAFSSTLNVGRDLTIDAGSSLSMNFGGGGNKSGPIVVTRNILINGTLSLGDAVGGDLSVKGNWTNNGTFNSNTRTVNLDGSSLQTIAGTVITLFQGLTLNNAAGFTLSGIDCSVAGTLNLLSGKFTTTTSRKVIVTSSGSVFRSGGWVFGNLQRHFTSGLNIARTFDIGNTSGHLPVTLTFTDVSTAGSIVMSVNDNDISSIGSSPLFSTASINRHWSIRNIDLVAGSTYSAQLNYLTPDADVACNLATLRAASVNAGIWQLYTNVSATTNSAFVSGITLSGTDSLALGNERGDMYYRTKSSGNWENASIWEVSNDNITWSNATDVPNASTSNATVRATHTIQRTINVPYTVKNITVDVGGILLTNVINNNYFNIYGNIICNGTIGNSTDNIGFNIEGTNDTISGSGTFNCKRIRKNATANQSTNLFIDMDITTYWNTSASLYNNSDNSSRFNVTINAGKTVRCASVSVDGVRGNGTANGGGTFTILGNLYADTLYLTTDNNAAGFGAHVNIGNGGVIYANTLYCNASGIAGHQLTVQDGGTLVVTGSNGFLNFSTTQNTYTLGATSTIHYAASAAQTIESGLTSYGHIQFSGSGNKTPNGSFSVRGDWTRTLPAVFVPLLYTVTINGTTSSTQKIKITGTGGTETYSYLVLQKGAGQKLQLADDSPTSIQVNGGNGGQPLQLKSGNLDLNGQLVYIPMVTSALVNNVGIDGNIADPERKIISTKTGGIFQMYNDDANSRFSTITKINVGNTCRLIVDTGATMIVGGLNRNSGIDFGSGLTYFSGTFQINTWGYVENNSPTYNSGAYLIYNPGGDYNRFKEWDSTSGAGYPHHVIVKNSTALLLNDDGPGGNGKADRAIAGDMTIEAGSTLILGDSTENNKLTIGKSVILDGTIRMPVGDTLNRADLYVGKDWTRSSSGSFTDNNKGVHFIGSDTSNITATGGQYFPFVYQEKDINTNPTQQFSPVFIGKKLKISTGKWDLKESDLFFKSDGNYSAMFAKVENGDLYYSGSGRAVVERFIPIDSSIAPAVLPTGKHRKSWQFLSVPTSGTQTINQAWQDSADSPNQNRYSGYGTQITGSVTNATSAAIGFDVFTATPSIKQYSASTNTWIGLSNTKSTPVESKKGYMLFVRGDRSVTTFNAPGKSTTLRTRGKLFSPVNPSQTTTVQANQFESIGNPYVSPIDFNLVGKTGVSVENAFWVWDPLLTGVEGLGGYQLLSAVNGDYLPTPGGTANYPTAQKCSTIQAGQAFFIHAPSAGPVNISFDENCKSENYSSAFRNSGNTGRYLRMQLNSVIQNQTATQDGAVIAWNSNYRKSVDAFDAVKLMNPGSSISLLHSSGQNLSIDARPLPRQIDTIPLTLNLTRSSAYQLHFEPDQLTGIPYSIALYDQMNYTVFNVDIERSSDVTINPILPLHLNKSRYFLIVKRQSSRSQLPISFVSEQNRLIRKNSENDTIQTVSTRIILNNQPLSLNIKKNESISLIHVFDAQGKLILKKECDTKAITKVPVDMKLPEISTGVYFIRLMTNTGNTYVVQFFSR